MVKTVSFRRGDIVQLNSGGQRMVVEEVEDERGERVRCRWYEDRRKREGIFYSEGLHHYQLLAAG